MEFWRLPASTYAHQLVGHVGYQEAFRLAWPDMVERPGNENPPVRFAEGPLQAQMFGCQLADCIGIAGVWQQGLADGQLFSIDLPVDVPRADIQESTVETPAFERLQQVQCAQQVDLQCVCRILGCGGHEGLARQMQNCIRTLFNQPVVQGSGIQQIMGDGGDQPPGTGPPCVKMIHHVATNEAGVAGHQEITHAGPPSLLRNLERVSPDCRNCGSLMTFPSPLLSFLVFSVVSRERHFCISFYALFMARMQGLNVCLNALSSELAGNVIWRKWLKQVAICPDLYAFHGGFCNIGS